jgi:hypothetical protein
MSEARRAPRVAYLAEVQCTGVGRGTSSPLNPRISDLSASGAFIDSLTQMPVGEKLRLVFQVNGREVDTTAEVAHSMPQFGMGVRFLELSEEDRYAIAQVVGPS